MEYISGDYFIQEVYSIILSDIAISAAFFTAPVKTADHQHNWRIIDGGYSPPQNYIHLFVRNPPDVEYCSKTVVYSWYKHRCTICSETEKIEDRHIIHSNPNCNERK
ncbi:hypothetical protein NPD5_3603 [Clostridium sporogenes]|uniref:Uncharacterized protein n=1 Tax=Clostridium sporogenes TaxID=1509 RepID=A0A1L3NEV9_CLOSG|nr:hypothetical protein [Clostridium sporogenes]APH14653.1 hypothetical protein NPD5_3603 [Clostridium sporogenes]